jgi:L-ascorbate metabolism protein UlaG (beta-lactamase superfamily)
MLLERRTRWPARVDEPTRLPHLDGAGAVITFIGHATFLIQTAVANILTDPMYSKRAGPLNVLGPRRVRRPAVPFEDLPRISTCCSVTTTTITATDACIFFAGDSAYASFFRDVRQRLGPIDLALLPIGAYEPRWFMQSVHMNPAEAVQAHMDLDASESIGMHFGTFQRTTEGIDERAAHSKKPAG